MTLYHPALSDWTQRVDSFWEGERTQFATPPAPALAADEETEVAIIGGGYCGLSAALHLARNGVATTVLEAGDIGWGASGRNGGFCSIGASFLGAGELKDQYGVEEALAFYRVLAEAVHLVEALARDEQIDLRVHGRGIWTFAHRPSRLNDLRAQAEACRDIGIPSVIVSPDEFSRQAFRIDVQHGALFEPVGFGLHPLAFCLGLASASTRRGANLRSRSRVLSWERGQRHHVLRTRDGSLKAKRVIVATNAWMPEDLVPELAGRVLPVMSNITTTAPIPQALWDEQGFATDCPAADTRAHLTYLRRLPDGRLLLGGRGDTTGRPEGLRAMQRMLERRRQRQFPALTGMSTSHAWRGLISATRRLTPAVGVLPDDASIGYAFGCHGNGVAFMTWAGRVLSDMILGKAVDLPAPLRGLPARFPLPQLRLWYLRAMLVRAWIEDEMD